MRVGLAREHELYGLGRIGQELDEPLLVLEQQIGPLVGGEAPGEADGQGLGIEDFLGVLQFRALGAPGEQLVA